MTSSSVRSHLVALVAEAMAAGARLKVIGEHLRIDHRTLQRWRKDPAGDGRKDAVRKVHNKLTDAERAEILRVVNLPEYRDMAPAEIVALLAERGQYVGSERTIYRVLKENGQLAHRGPGRARTKRERPSHEATGPGQLLSWDITYLLSSMRGVYFYLYLVMDVWSRKIVAWEVHSEELSALSAEMMDHLAGTMPLKGTILHADNGSPMKGSTMLEKLYELGVTASFSRPRVSEDNPFSESLFRTLKYRPGYPKAFATMHSARCWIADFVNWYNNVHRHSGIGYVTPAQRHSGIDRPILEKRRATFEAARERHPERWSRNTKSWKYIDNVKLGRKKERVEAAA